MYDSAPKVIILFECPPYGLFWYELSQNLILKTNLLLFTKYMIEG